MRILLHELTKTDLCSTCRENIENNIMLLSINGPSVVKFVAFPNELDEEHVWNRKKPTKNKMNQRKCKNTKVSTHKKKYKCSLTCKYKNDTDARLTCRTMLMTQNDCCFLDL